MTDVWIKVIPITGPLPSHHIRVRLVSQAGLSLHPLPKLLPFSSAVYSHQEHSRCRIHSNCTNVLNLGINFLTPVPPLLDCAYGSPFNATTDLYPKVGMQVRLLVLSGAVDPLIEAWTGLRCPIAASPLRDRSLPYPIRAENEDLENVFCNT